MTVDRRDELLRKDWGEEWDALPEAPPLRPGGTMESFQVAQGDEYVPEAVAEDGREIELALRELDEAIDYLAQSVDEISRRLAEAGVLHETSDKKVELPPQRIQLTKMAARIDSYRMRVTGIRGVLGNSLDRLEL